MKQEDHMLPPIPLPSSNESFAVGMSSPNSNGTYVTIQLLADSSPLFYKCNETSVNGSSAFPGLNVTSSLIQALTDGNPDTQILGNVNFSINFQKPFTNEPGRDLIIYEGGNNTESLTYISIMALVNGTAYDSFMNPWNYAGVPLSLDNTDSCGNPINIVQLDLTELGIPRGSTITGLSE